jgi:alkylation response protein AidB-like acyl-CoA dehydrogenase
VVVVTTADQPADTVGLLADLRALAPEVEANLEWMDRERCLPVSVVESARAGGLFRISLARERGGLELDPLAQLELIEELSRQDASVGWVLGFAALSGYVRGFLDADVAADLFGRIDAATAGQYAPMGRAERVPGGYRVSGQWGFGSGCRHADVMMAGCLITEDGVPRRGPDGAPEVRLMLFAPSKCVIDLDSWDTTGLRATGSHDYSIDELHVPDEHTFHFFDEPKCDGPLYRLPGLFLSVHAAFPLGIGRAAIDALVALSAEKVMQPGGRLLREESQVQEAVAWAEASLGSVRSYVFDCIGDLWDTLAAGEDPSPRQRALYRLSMIHAHQVAKDVVARLYDTAATSAIQRGTPLDRHLRDILAVCQHRVVQAKIYRPAGKQLLGLDPRDPLF